LNFWIKTGSTPPYRGIFFKYIKPLSRNDWNRYSLNQTILCVQSNLIFEKMLRHLYDYSIVCAMFETIVHWTIY